MTPKYNAWFTMFLMSITSAHLVLLNFNFKNTLQLIKGTYYAYSMIGSTLIAMAAIAIVREVSLRLDKKYKWEEHLVTRLALQGLRGVIMVMGVVVLLVTIYWGLAGEWILDTKWFAGNFLVELLMVVTLNCYFMIYYFVVCRDRIFVRSAGPGENSDHDEIADAPSQEPKLELLLGKQVIDIAHILSNKEEQVATFKDGNTRPWKYGIKNGIDMLPKDLFMIANRSEIINFDNILYTEFTNVEKSLMKAYLFVPEQKIVEVSRDNTSANKSRLKKYLK